MALVGREESLASDWNPQTETTRWIGKPWRRLELLTIRSFYRGEEVDRSRDLTLHVGLRRFGVSLTLILGRRTVLDYSEERQ